MKALAMILLVGVAAGCSKLPTSGDGIVALEIRSPTALTLKLGDSLTFSARALNQQGDSVAADILWQTPDTARITVDPVRGVVHARVGTGTGRVQASVGTLHSDLITITLQP
jgi:hypothetical protein